MARFSKATGMSLPVGVADPVQEIIAAEVSGYSAIRGREQQLHDYYKLKGFKMGNTNNPVWEYNPFAKAYWVASTLAFGLLEKYGATY